MAGDFIIICKILSIEIPTLLKDIYIIIRDKPREVRNTPIMKSNIL